MEIEDFFKEYKTAAWEKDSAAMIRLYDTSLVQFDMWDKGYCTNPRDWTAEIENWLGSLGEERVQADFEMVRIHRSDSIGFASALIQFQAISPDGRVVRGMKNRITLGFVKQTNGWKVVHQHISAPVSSDTLLAILQI